LVERERAVIASYRVQKQTIIVAVQQKLLLSLGLIVERVACDLDELRYVWPLLTCSLVLDERLHQIFDRVLVGETRAKLGVDLLLVELNTRD